MTLQASPQTSSNIAWPTNVVFSRWRIVPLMEMGYLALWRIMEARLRERDDGGTCWKQTAFVTGRSYGTCREGLSALRPRAAPMCGGEMTVEMPCGRNSPFKKGGAFKGDWNLPGGIYKKGMLGIGSHPFLIGLVAIGADFPLRLVGRSPCRERRSLQRTDEIPAQRISV